MKSIKPGRGPSMMGAFGSIAAAAFGVLWTLSAASMGAPVYFVLFGVVFIIVGIVQAVYNYKNATGKNRFSSFDITDGNEEPDPLNQYFNGDPMAQNVSEQGNVSRGNHNEEIHYCPYCGADIEPGFLYCAKCGKQLPE